MSELLKRILTASILAPLVIWWLLWSASPVFETLLGLLSVAVMFEMVLMLGLPLRWLFLLSGSAATAWTVEGGNVAVILTMLSIVWMAIMVFAARGADGEQVRVWTRNLSYGLWLMLWIMMFVAVLANLHPQSHGPIFLLAAFVGVWSADIGAYFAGRAFGRHKLCPAISPGKTIEGAVAGILLGTIAAAAIWVRWSGLELLPAILIALALGITSVIGDLAESAIKRSVGVKDSGRMLPGHGGLLDRVDALLPAVTLAGVLELLS